MANKLSNDEIEFIFSQALTHAKKYEGDIVGMVIQITHEEDEDFVVKFLCAAHEPAFGLMLQNYKTEYAIGEGF